MSTLRQIVYNVRNLVDDELELSSVHISERHLKYVIKYYRALLLRRELWRGSKLSPFEQGFQSNFSFKQSKIFGRNALVSDKDIPDPIRVKNRAGVGITYIGDKVANIAYSIVNIHRNRSQKYSKYTGDKTFASYIDNKVYLFGGLPDSLSSGDTKTFDIRGIFRDPEEVMRIIDPGSETMEKPFPLSSDMEQRIVTSLANGELSLMVGRNTQTNES